ncbi:MAG: DUF2326 domain-containing protein, partial [Pyrinomonadaceae bacterium]
IAQRKIEMSLQKRLRRERTQSQISQSLLVVNRQITGLTKQKETFKVNERYSDDLSLLNETKAEINRLATEQSGLELRKVLIEESRADLEKDLANIDTGQIRKFYEEAKLLVPSIQRSFEETVRFHNRMILEKVKYIAEELPGLESDIVSLRVRLDGLLDTEKAVSEKLARTVTSVDFEKLVSEINLAYEQRGRLQEQLRMWQSSLQKVNTIEQELSGIDQGIISKDQLIQERVAEFNSYFAEISNRLYGEQFILSADRNERGYELAVTSVGGNLGTGKKKGEIAAFDLAYIQFADALNIRCLHFVMQDQIENVHDNQITGLFTEIVSGVNCQYVLPVLRDKLPADLDVELYKVLSLSQEEKLFRI